MTQKVSIGEASRSSGVKVPTIRYYEQIGLLPSPPRTESNRRTFDGRDLRRLTFIRHARELGFELDAIRTLLSLQDDPNEPCGMVTPSHVQAWRRSMRIDSLRALKDELDLMIESCRHGKVADCRVIEVLADHGKCLHLQH